MTVPIRPPDPRVMKALAAYKKQGLNRLADMAGLSQGTGDAVQSFAMGATEPLDVKGALRAARRGIGALYHGSPNTALEVLASHPPARQYDNATSVFGGFATPDKAEAARYAGKAGRVYEVDGSLSNPHEMSWGEFGRFQAPHKAHDGSPLPPDAWAKRAEQLKQEAQALRKQLEAAGHDGIVVRDSRGNVKEQAFFRDTPMRDSLTVSGVRRGIEAWHGSPHKFDKFSLEKIGTGEGAQAYGHGLYFAESPDVAKSYKTAGAKNFQQNARLIDGVDARIISQRLDVAPEQRLAADALYRNPTIADAVQYLEQDAYKPDIKKALEWIRANEKRIVLRNEGALYRVRLDVSPDELLDWDKPLAQQPEKVRKVAQEFGMDATDHGYDELVKEAEAQAKDAFMRWKADPTDDKYREFLRADDDQRKIWNSRASSKSGKDVYQEIGVRGDAEASRRLRERGIPGIRYLDGGSRAAGDGTRNYVIFDPERIQILERLAALGIGGEAVRTMLAQAKAAAQPQPSHPPTLPAVTVGR